MRNREAAAQPSHESHQKTEVAHRLIIYMYYTTTGASTKVKTPTAKHILKGENYKKENKLILLPRQQQYY